LIYDTIFAQIALQESELVATAFAGPEGHGKTELAEKVGETMPAK